MLAELCHRPLLLFACFCYRNGENVVPDDGSPHQSTPLVIPVYRGRYENGDRIRPRYHHILIPPSGHNDANVEAQDERQRN